MKYFFITLIVLSLGVLACRLPFNFGLIAENDNVNVEVDQNISTSSESENEPASDEGTATSEDEVPGSWISNPAPVGVEVVADQKSFVVLSATRPADEIVRDANRLNYVPEDGEEYLLVEIQITCMKPSDEECSFTPFTMLVFGSAEEKHFNEFVAGLESRLKSVDFAGGETVSGMIPFIVRPDETDLLLVYEPISGGAFFFELPVE
jgi:hypothetical protein